MCLHSSHFSYQGIVGCTPIPTYPVMGNPYIRPITRGYLWVSYPQESQGRTPAKYHGYTYVRGTPHCPLKLMVDWWFGFLGVPENERDGPAPPET